MKTEIISDNKFLENFKNNKFVAGTRQSLKFMSMHPEKVKCVILARNTSENIISKILQNADSADLDVYYIESKIKLAEFAKIDVPTSIVAILK